MKLKIEEVQENNRALIIAKSKSHVFEAIKRKLEHYRYQVFFSSHPPENIESFSIVFFINYLDNPELINKKTKNKVCLILFNKKRHFFSLAKKINQAVKIINLNPHSFSSEILEKIFWFLLTSSKENILNLENELTEPKRKITKEPINPPKIRFNMKKRRLLVYGILIFLIVEFFFTIPLFISLFFLYQSYHSFKKENQAGFQKNFTFFSSTFSLAKKSYQISRPFLSLFYFAIVPDEIYATAENVQILLNSSFSLINNTQKTLGLILKPERDKYEQKELFLRIKIIENNLEKMEEKISLLTQKINFPFSQSPKIKSELVRLEESIKQAKKIFIFLDEILGKDKEKKYLILFQNNMELRPGGGFIGSFGVAKFHQYHLKELKIYDVYDADGQLKAHIDPPEPIRKYLNQPHWFLRDSNFSPDFKENFLKAEFFLEKEMGLTNFDGGLALTTTAIKNILEAFGEIYLPDYEEKITKDNFYLKTQLYAEKNFFPGSTQKKTFLSSLVKALMVNLEEVSFQKLFLGIKKSLDEKHLVFYFKDENLDNEINRFGWGGRLILPQCVAKNTRCLIDSFYPIDANLGVNKANFFINRLVNFKISIKPDGTIENLLSLTFKNEATLNEFPGGIYHNYFQVYLPSQSRIKGITKDGEKINDWDEESEANFKIIGFFFQTAPQKTTEIKINYLLTEKVVKGKNLYQLITQKQIGSSNNDFVLEVYLPKNVYIINQNFSALAKDNHLVYNTTLSTDKIFFIELIKE